MDTKAQAAFESNYFFFLRLQGGWSDVNVNFVIVSVLVIDFS
jgi:hypothetical protein